jgi:hypothetical protein
MHTRDDYGKYNQDFPKSIGALHIAASFGLDRLVQQLLGCEGIEPDSKSLEFGPTPLLYAARHGHDAVMRLLLGCEGVMPTPSQSMGVPRYRMLRRAGMRQWCDCCWVVMALSRIPRT